MKKRLFALVLLLLLLAGCTAAPEADYMAPVRAYCLALQNNDFSQLQQAMPAAVLSSNGLDAGELDELRAPFLTHAQTASPSAPTQSKQRILRQRNAPHCKRTCLMNTSASWTSTRRSS